MSFAKFIVRSYSVESLLHLYNRLVVLEESLPACLDFYLRVESTLSQVQALRDFLFENFGHLGLKAFISDLSVTPELLYLSGGEVRAVRELLCFSVVNNENLIALHKFSGGNLLHLQIQRGDGSKLLNRAGQKVDLGSLSIHSTLGTLDTLRECICMFK
nr:hypothetical protein [Grapevine virus N]UKT68835.1 hypothetical protein [Grapevine virus N]UKT68840.1 hypothetical protein [Grapevine virus N]